MIDEKNHKPLILAVDDAQVILKLITICLKDNYEVATSKSGKEAIEFMEKRVPDMVLLDIEMPDMNGYEVCSWIKTKPHLDNTSVIFITGNTGTKDKVKAFKAGGVDYLIKPFEAAELIARIKTHLSIQNMKKALEANNKLLKRQMKEIEEKSRQLREKDIQLLSMDRIAGITTLAAGIAHEINNPLSFVKGALNFVEKGVHKMSNASKFWEDKPIQEQILEEYREYLSQMNFNYLANTLDEKFNRIKKGIERIVVIVKNLKSFSRVDKEDISLIDINNSIKEVIEVLRTDKLENVEFIYNLQKVPLFNCLGNDIHQCLLCVIQNAIDAVEGNGIIKICNSYNEEKKQIIVKIIDNGKGMDEKTLRKAMTPFFTTKQVGDGTGLGLTITEKILTRHKGQIKLASIEGNGTTVTLEFTLENGII